VAAILGITICEGCVRIAEKEQRDMHSLNFLGARRSTTQPRRSRRHGWVTSLDDLISYSVMDAWLI
jgi:hypothetical protein